MHNFQKVIENLIVLFQELSGVERLKLQAASENRVATVEECMKKEQAMILKLKGLDKDRENAQKELGYEGCSFQEILAQVLEEEKEQLQPLFEELERQIQAFQEVSENATKVMEINLHQIQKAVQAKDGNVYTEDGGSVKTEQHMTNRRV